MTEVACCQLLIGLFDGHFRDREKICAPVDLVPAEMRDVEVETMGGGDLYCISFRKPG